MLKEYLLDKIEYLYNQRDYENLMKTCDELLETDRDNPAALNYKAIALYYLERYDEAMELLEYTLNLHPENPYVLNNRALIHIALGNYRQALECCEEGLKHKDFDWLQINKIEALIHLGREEEALEFFKSVRIPDYTFEDALANCGKAPKDELYENLENLLGEGKFEDALKLCDAHEPTEKLFGFRIASLFCLERYDEALECVNEAIGEYPYNYNFHLTKAKISRNLDDSIQEYERAFEIIGSVSNHRLQVNEYVKCLKIKAHSLIECGEYKGAIVACAKAMNYLPEKGG